MTTLEVPNTSDTANKHDEVHVTCENCQPHGAVAMCGAPLKGVTFPDETPVTCAVCEELEFLPCGGCGT